MDKQLRSLLLLLVPLAAAAYLTIPHLADELWYDEAYTLNFFVAPGLTEAFTNYHAPNNHVLFSAVLAAWIRILPDDMISVFTLRLLPMAFYLGSILVCFKAFSRIAGEMYGILAAVLMLTSHVTICFAVQLRGYGISWLPVTGAMLVLIMHRRRPRVWTAAAYMACAAIAAGILPTNLLPFGILALWELLLQRKNLKEIRTIRRIAFLAAAPAAGALFYLGVWRELLSTAKDYSYNLSFSYVAQHWLWATMVDLWWLLPFAAVGIVASLRNSATPAREDDTQADMVRKEVAMLVLAIVIATPLFLLVLPHMPVPRVLTPILPLWYGAFAAMICKGIHLMARAYLQPIVLTLAAILLITAAIRESDNAGYATNNPEGSKPQNLYHQYYHHNFHPYRTTAVLTKLSMERPTVIFTDHSDVWSILYLGGKRIKVYDYVTAKIAPGSAERFQSMQVLILSHSDNRATKVAEHLNTVIADIPVLKPQLVESTGFFRIYRCW